jgi:hypothetical protein
VLLRGSFLVREPPERLAVPLLAGFFVSLVAGVSPTSLDGTILMLGTPRWPELLDS